MLEKLVEKCYQKHFIATDVVVNLFLQDSKNYETLMKILDDFHN